MTDEHMRTIVIVKVGSTMPALADRKGDFEDWILSGMGTCNERARVVDVRNGVALPSLDEISAIVVTGSHAMVTEHHDWSRRTAEWLAGCVGEGIPTLGICYGHQLLAYALGGEVGNNPSGLEFGTVEVRVKEWGKDDVLLGGFSAPLKVHVSHTQSVLRLPDKALLLACSERDANQAFAIGDRAWGLQFHPEFDAEIVREYIHAHREELLRDGQNPAELIAKSIDTPFGTEILRRFAAIANDRASS